MTAPPKDLIPAEELAAFAVHPLAELFPMISDDELRELAEDIRKNGMIEPITLCEGKILDGRNRFNAAKLISFPFRRANFRELLCHLDPRTYVISANIKRRHLTAEQKRSVIASLVKADPTKSNRQIAETTKTDHKTVAAVRGELEVGGEIPHQQKTVGKDGVAQPTKTKRGGKGGKEETLKYPRVTNSITARKAYGVFEQHLLDALQDVSEKSDFSQADELAQATIERLQEKLGKLQPEMTEAAE
jgi:ParB-like chromosome segregation protein Spo0J